MYRPNDSLMPSCVVVVDVPSDCRERAGPKAWRVVNALKSKNKKMDFIMVVGSDSEISEGEMSLIV